MLRNGHVIAIALLLVSCGKEERHQEQTGNLGDVSTLEAKHAQWLLEIDETSDPDSGWPSATDCDATLWAGLAVAAGAQGVALELAEHSPGEIHRRPLQPCWTPEKGDVGSKSTVSQDMLTGYLWGLWRRQDLAALQRLAAYGEAHRETLAGAFLGWRMGEPYPDEISRVLMRTNLVGLVGRMLFALSNGLDDRSYRHEGTQYIPVSEDYAQHVMVLGILLQGETRPSVVPLVDIDGQELERLRELAEAYPQDALYQAALAVYTGETAKAESLLLDPAYQCPSYVRGSPNYCAVHKSFAASIVLKYNPKGA